MNRSLRAIAIGLLATLCACGGVAKDGGPDHQLLIVDAPHPLSFEPSSTGRIYTQMGVAETLVEARPSGDLQPGLAAGWTHSADRVEWRFALRPGTRFHDGSPVTADAVTRALERARRRPGVMSFVPIERITADGDQVLIRLTAPSTLLLPVLANFSTQILAPSSFDEKDRAIAAIGTGPYKVRSTTEQELTVEAWPGWRGEAPAIRHVRYLSAGRAETRGNLAESGQADLIVGLDTATELRLRQRADIHVLKAASPRSIYMKVNAAHPLLRDSRVRRALSLAIDRRGIASGFLFDPARTATQLLPPSVPGWHQPDLAPLRYDPAAARRQLASLGWRSGPDGVLVRNGRRFAITLISHSVTPELPLIAAAIQEQLRVIGVAMAIHIGAAAEVPAAHRNGTLQLALVSRGFMLVPDPVGALLQDYADGGGEYGAMNWNDPEVSAALKALARGTDPATARRLRAGIMARLQSELPVIPVVYVPRTAAASARVQGAFIDPLERDYGLARLRWHR